MRGLFKNVANELIQQMTPDDLREIMDNTIVVVLSKMTQEQRLEFSQEVVNNSINHMLDGLTVEQRVELIQSVLPVILQHLGRDLEEMSPEEIAAILGQR